MLKTTTFIALEKQPSINKYLTTHYHVCLSEFKVQHDSTGGESKSFHRLQKTNLAIGEIAAAGTGLILLLFGSAGWFVLINSVVFAGRSCTTTSSFGVKYKNTSVPASLAA